jgi:Domain of unknown function (DUF4401)
MNWSDLTQLLHADGVLTNPHVTDTTPVPESGYGRWLSVLGAWFAALLLLGFIGALTGHLLENDVFCGIVGSLFLATGIWMGRNGSSKNSVMLGQFSIIACVLGGILLAKAFFGIGFETSALFALAALCVPCLLLTNEQSQRLLFAVAGIAFLCLALAKLNLTFVAWLLSVGGLIYVCFQQDRWVISKRGELFNSIIFALSLGVLLTPQMLSKHGRMFGFFENFNGEVTGLHSFGSSDITWALMGAISALITATVGYRTGLQSLRGLGLAAILGYGYMFYFSLGTTLLHKSYALFATGALLLAIRLWASKNVRMISSVKRGTAS